jgi:predicted amidophosphoribosyltransferase
MPIAAAQHTVLQLLKNLSATFASVCFPANCRLCDEPLTDARRVAILSQFQPILPGYCESCGLPATFDPEFPKETACCADCRPRRFGFDLARSYGYYEGTLSRAVVLLKHE